MKTELYMNLRKDNVYYLTGTKNTFPWGRTGGAFGNR
mgnify:CR=1 FL=1